MLPPRRGPPPVVLPTGRNDRVKGLPKGATAVPLPSPPTIYRSKKPPTGREETDPMVRTPEQVEQELEFLDQRIGTLVRHQEEIIGTGSNEEYQYQVQLNALTRQRASKTLELISLGSPSEPRKPMSGELDELYLKLWQALALRDNRDSPARSSEFATERNEELINDLLRQIRDWELTHQPASAVHVVDTDPKPEQQRENVTRIQRRLAEQWFLLKNQKEILEQNNQSKRKRK